MKIGFMTNSLVWAGLDNFKEITKWAIEHHFEDLEVGPNVPLEEKVFNSVLDTGKIDISALIYCRNFLCENEEEATHHKAELIDRINFAPKVGIRKIICSTGVSNTSSVENNKIKYDPEACVDEFIDVFKELVELAEKNDVKLCFENCPIMGNIAISPYMWDVIFDRLPSDHLGIAFDPSHFVWQFMDPYKAILKHGNKIFHVHGKDCEVNYEKLSEIGILHNFSKTHHSDGIGENAFKKMWWRYRLVGNGDLNWGKIIANLEEVGYNGTISIEHEDPVWEGSIEKVKIGLLKSQRYLKNLTEL